MTVAVIGLGEAGKQFADHLATRVEVIGFDVRPTSADFTVAATVTEAVQWADTVLAFTPAESAKDAILSIADAVQPGVRYIDFCTASPAQKRELGRLADSEGLGFAEAAIMESVTGDVSRVPVLVGGGLAAEVAAQLRSWGLRAAAVPGPVGSAAARKLIRSIAVKGLTAAFVEATRAAADEDLLDWWEAHRRSIINELDVEKLDRYLNGTLVHYLRRIHELAAASEMQEGHGRSAPLARGTEAVLRSIADRGIPGIGEAP